MEIIFLEPVYKDYIWGGNRLKQEFNKNTPYEKTAESWEVSTNKNGKSIITNGEFKGLNLDELFQKKDLRKKYFGTKCEELEKFPLLIKFIDAKNDLSVQVHPDDEYAKKYENDSGKSEMWYVLDCKKNAKLIYGLKDDLRKEQIKEIVKSGKIKEYLKYVNIEKGDCVNVPSGTIHAILSDTLICEIQQNCDLTYRVYDWDRVDKNGNQRELHIDKAIDVINLDNKLNILKANDEHIQNLLNSEKFKVDKIKVKEEYNSESRPETFIAVSVVEGEGLIVVNKKEYRLKKGTSFIIPSELGKYKIRGELTILESYI